MAVIEEVVKISVEGADKGTTSVKSLKQEIREAQAEAIKIARSFGEFSPEATKAAQKVAKLKDEMGDFQERVAALNPDKFQAIAGVVQGIAGGIAAAQGAMALFGMESEDSAKAMMKVQGAIALSQGIQQILNMKNSLGAMASVIRTQVVTAFTTLRGAIVATGIGALAVALGILIEKLSSVGSEAKEATEKMQGLNEVINEQADLLNNKRAATIAAAKRYGASEAELHAMERMQFDDRILMLQKSMGFEGTNLELRKQIQTEINKIQTERYIFDQNFYAQQEKAQRDSIAKRNAEQQAAYEKQLAEQKAFQQQQLALFEALQSDMNAKIKSANDVQKEIADERRRIFMDDRQKEIDDLNKWYEEKAAILANGGEDALNITYLYEDKLKQLNDKFIAEDVAATEKKNADLLAKDKAIKDKEIAQEKIKQDAIKQARDEAYNQTSSALGALANLFGQATAAGKAAAITQVAIDQAKALSGALAVSQSPTPDNVATGGIAGIVKYATIAASILSSFARIKNILGSSGGGGVSQPQSFAVNSGFLPTSDQSANQLQGMGRVYVLEGDISRSQSNVSRNRGVSVV